MVIRSEQVQHFDDVLRAKFETELVEFSRTVRPSARQFADDAAELQFVRAAMERARSWGFTDRDFVQLTLELMLRLGNEFDADAQFPWARVILHAEPRDPEFIMATQLYNGMKDFLERVQGPGNALLLAAYGKIASTPDEAWVIRSSDGQSALLTMLRYFYPQRFDYIGERALRHIMAKGIEDARRVSMPPRIGVPLFSGIAFLLGHGALADPQYPWIAAALEDPRVTSPEEQPRNLLHRLKERLARAAAPATP